MMFDRIPLKKRQTLKSGFVWDLGGAGYDYLGETAYNTIYHSSLGIPWIGPVVDGIILNNIMRERARV